MSEERMRILNMVANGKITAEQADKLLQALQDPTASGGPSSRSPRFICVKVAGNDTVDVRVPVALLRTGIKLTALIPPQALTHIDEHLKERHIDFDIRNIKKEDLDELISHLGEMKIDVQSRSGDNVRVYCE